MKLFILVMWTFVETSVSPILSSDETLISPHYTIKPIAEFNTIRECKRQLMNAINDNPHIMYECIGRI